MKKTYMFIVYVTSETNPKLTTGYFTNTVMSKNDGALITFRDSSDVVHNLDPLRITIKLNVDEDTHIAKTL